MSARSPKLRAPSPTLDPELVAWVKAEADRRVCHPRVVIEAGIRLLREALDTAPDLVDLPRPPRSSATS